MSLNSFLHDPTWMKVYGAGALGCASLLPIAAMRIKVVRKRKRDIYKPATMIAETFGAEDAGLTGASGAPAAPKPLLAAARAGFAGIGVLCVVVAICCFLFSLRQYRVLANWDDGNSHMFIGDYVGALVCFEKARRADSTLNHTHLLMGIALLRAGKSRAAIEELKLAAADRGDAEPAWALGDALMLMKRPEEAIAAYRRAIAISPGNVDYYIALAAAQTTLKRPTDAYKTYEKAIEIDPFNWKAHVKLGWLLATYGHMDEATAHCSRAVSLAPNNVIAHNTLAATYARFGKFDDAVVEYRKAIDLDPRSPLSFYDLGVSFERKKDVPHAIQAFKNTIKLPARNKADVDAIHMAEDEIKKLESL